MEQLANKGNGNYYYIDGISQARRVFQEQIGGTLQVVAKDVKIQVDFNPAQVESYRLVGYENRAVADQEFRDDKVDAGEIGAGHTVTAMYEIVLAGNIVGNAAPAVVRIRAKRPRGEKAREWAYAFDPGALHSRFADASDDFRFATAVMGAAEILRASEHAESWQLGDVVAIAQGAAGRARDRREFIELMSGLRPFAGTSPSRREYKRSDSPVVRVAGN
jgi:Ca-activated chloride channel family protein